MKIGHYVCYNRCRCKHECEQEVPAKDAKDEATVEARPGVLRDVEEQARL